MTEELLSVADQEEALSRAYVRAIAARAGYSTAYYDYDRTGVDLRIQAGGAMRPAIELQLKATVNLTGPKDGHYHFPLQRKNYDELIVATQTPRILLVMDLPQDSGEWLTTTVDHLILRKCAYWLNLRPYPETTNTSSVTVKIPETNLFDVERLRYLMEQSKKGVIQ